MLCAFEAEGEQLHGKVRRDPGASCDMFGTKNEPLLQSEAGAHETLFIDQQDKKNFTELLVPKTSKKPS